jgi:hypothetical protein
MNRIIDFSKSKQDFLIQKNELILMKMVLGSEKMKEEIDEFMTINKEKVGLNELSIKNIESSVKLTDVNISFHNDFISDDINKVINSLIKNNNEDKSMIKILKEAEVEIEIINNISPLNFSLYYNGNNVNLTPSTQTPSRFLDEIKLKKKIEILEKYTLDKYSLKELKKMKMQLLYSEEVDFTKIDNMTNRLINTKMYELDKFLGLMNVILKQIKIDFLKEVKQKLTHENLLKFTKVNPNIFFREDGYVVKKLS